MPLGVKRSGAGHFDDVHAPEMFGAEQLNRRAATAEPLPRLQRHVLDFVHTDVPMNRHALCFHEEIIGRFGIFPVAETGLLPGFRFAPFKDLRARFHAHIDILLPGGKTTPSRLVIKTQRELGSRGNTTASYFRLAETSGDHDEMSAVL